MAYQKFEIKKRPKFETPVDSGDNGDKTAKSPPIVTTVAAVTTGHDSGKRIWHFEDIMALPVMPCTTCRKFQPGYRPSCERYKSLAQPRIGCRCVHYESKL